MTSIANSLERHMIPVQCRFSILRDNIYNKDPDDGQAIDAAIRSGLTCNKIAIAIRSGGHKISHSTIQAHKDRVCICEGVHQWV